MEKNKFVVWGYPQDSAPIEYVFRDEQQFVSYLLQRRHYTMSEVQRLLKWVRGGMGGTSGPDSMYWTMDAPETVDFSGCPADDFAHPRNPRD